MSAPSTEVVEDLSGRPGSALRRIGLVLALFLVAGAAAGVLWERLWDPTTGLTYQGQWYLEPAGPDQSFSSIALFVAIAVPLGLVLGVLCGVWRGQEVTTTVSVLVAAGVAGLVMYAVGHALGPADPQVLAAAEPDYTTLPGDLVLTAPDADRVAWHSSALVAFPAGAMAGLVGTYLLAKQGLTRRQRG